MAGTKYCKHCGQVIDVDCVVCPKCGKQVEQLNMGSNNAYGAQPIIINNNNSTSSSASSSAAAAAGFGGVRYRKRPWYLNWFWIIVIGFLTGGIGFFILIPMRIVWK